MNTPTTSSVKAFVSKYWFEIIMIHVFGFGLFSVFASVAAHREEVKTVSLQNAGCIYLEKSDLGAGQHYMICNGQISLKRVIDGAPENTEQALKEALPEVTPTNNVAVPGPTPGPTPPAK